MYFTPVFIQFFEELTQNNHKEWFDANRKVYESRSKGTLQESFVEITYPLKSRNYEPTSGNEGF
jgi:uncharacterized protein (DUF2461 family)